MPLHDPNILLPADPIRRAIARGLYEGVRDLPIISPHGHVDPAWFAQNEHFKNPTDLFVSPDHYVLRMLVSQGATLAELGLVDQDGHQHADKRAIWRRFCAGYHLFRATPSRVWLEYAFEKLFGLTERPSVENADALYDAISQKLAEPAFLPRALFDRFNIEVLATTEDPLDDLSHHQSIRSSGWTGRVITTYRPDNVIDPEHTGFTQNVEHLGILTKCDTQNWQGYLQAHRLRRAYFRSFGATATDHGHPTARTENLSCEDAAALFDKVVRGQASPQEAERFRGQMLTEMAHEYPASLSYQEITLKNLSFNSIPAPASKILVRASPIKS